MASLNSLGQDERYAVQPFSFWCWHHMMLSAFFISPLHSVVALASYDATGVGVTHCYWYQYQCHIMPTA